ncbi:hypothetical protein FJZ31_41215 [Candidatus Poribacteria bacterium]|nr:hypothetical protein [Candidatus Poribacteria bacterium]
MPLTLIEKRSTLTIINSDNEKTLSELEQLYPEKWMLLEVTDDENHEPQKAKVVAVAEEDMELVDIWKKCGRNGINIALIHGVYIEPQPAVVV